MVGAAEAVATVGGSMPEGAAPDSEVAAAADAMAAEVVTAAAAAAAAEVVRERGLPMATVGLPKTLRLVVPIRRAADSTLALLTATGAFSCDRNCWPSTRACAAALADARRCRAVCAVVDFDAAACTASAMVLGRVGSAASSASSAGVCFCTACWCVERFDCDQNMFQRLASGRLPAALRMWRSALTRSQSLSPSTVNNWRKNSKLPGAKRSRRSRSACELPNLISHLEYAVQIGQSALVGQTGLYWKRPR